MAESPISVKDFAERHGLLRQTVFKILRRLQIEPMKSRGGDGSRGQTVSYISEKQAAQVLEAISSSKSLRSEQGSEEFGATEAALYDVGVFYLLCLEPEHDSNRFKVGFASNLPERLRQHRCSAPFATVVGTWPCRRLWEKTAIECVTQGCQQLHTEVFRSESLPTVAVKCEQFFFLMPTISSTKQD